MPDAVATTFNPSTPSITLANPALTRSWSSTIINRATSAIRGISARNREKQATPYSGSDGSDTITAVGPRGRDQTSWTVVPHCHLRTAASPADISSAQRLVLGMASFLTVRG